MQAFITLKYLRPDYIFIYLLGVLPLWLLLARLLSKAIVIIHHDFDSELFSILFDLLTR